MLFCLLSHALQMMNCLCLLPASPSAHNGWATHFSHLPTFCCITDTLQGCSFQLFFYRFPDASQCWYWVWRRLLAPAHILQEVIELQQKRRVRTWGPTDTKALRHRPRPRSHGGNSPLTERLSASARAPLNCVCSTSHFCVTCCPKLKAAGPTPFASLPLLCLFSSCLQAPKGKWLSTIRWSPQEARTLTVHTFRHTALLN